TNPLIGPTGAATTYGPQKGADQGMITELDRALTRFAALLPIDPRSLGTGAAGGTGYALRVWGADLSPGSAAVGDLIGLPDALVEADLVITGEGSFDGQSAAGKVPSYVTALAAEMGTPTALVAGRIASR